MNQLFHNFPFSVSLSHRRTALCMKLSLSTFGHPCPLVPSRMSYNIHFMTDKLSTIFATPFQCVVAALIAGHQKEETSTAIKLHMGHGGGCFLACEDLGEFLTLHSPPAFFFFLVEVCSRVLIPLFKQGLVHSG